MAVESVIVGLLCELHQRFSFDHYVFLCRQFVPAMLLRKRKIVITYTLVCKDGCYRGAG